MKMAIQVRGRSGRGSGAPEVQITVAKQFSTKNVRSALAVYG